MQSIMNKLEFIIASLTALSLKTGMICMQSLWISPPTLTFNAYRVSFVALFTPGLELRYYTVPL